MMNGPRSFLRGVRVAFAAGVMACVACATANLNEDDGVRLPERIDVDGGDASDLNDTSTLPPVDAFVPPPVDAATTPRVFLSSTTSAANFGGIAGADLACTNLAIGAGLIGKWAAWLSNQDGPHARDRITSAGPWKLVTGEIVAATKPELIGGVLQHAIDRDEKGNAVPASRVWTGTSPTGVYSTNDCDKWRNGGNGRVGDSTSKTATWTSAGVDDCDGQRHIYCFEL